MQKLYLLNSYYHNLELLTIPVTLLSLRCQVMGLQVEPVQCYQWTMEVKIS